MCKKTTLTVDLLIHYILNRKKREYMSMKKMSATDCDCGRDKNLLTCIKS